jgi:hypothetical protein
MTRRDYFITPRRERARLGFVLQQTTLAIDTSKDPAEMAEAFRKQLPAHKYPNLSEMVDRATKLGYDYADEFEFGLDLTLDGLERLREPA